MVNLKGALKFNRELRAGEINIIKKFCENVKIDDSKPNRGIFPFRFLSDFTGFEWDGTEAYEIEGLLKILIAEYIPKDVFLNGTFIYEETVPVIDSEEVYFNGYKIYVDNNRITIFAIDEDLPEKAKLLRCPHCQKIFNKEAFTEVFE